MEIIRTPYNSAVPEV